MNFLKQFFRFMNLVAVDEIGSLFSSEKNS
jgi:hypothetical protein